MTYEAKTYDEIKEEIVVNIIQNVDNIVDINEGSVLDIYVSAFSTEFENVYEDLSTINSSLKISTATNDDLDEIGEASGVPRNEGTTASCIVSFIRQAPASSSFLISQGTLTSTNPSGDTIYKFSTNADETFLTEVSSLNVNFYNGIFYYKVDNRKLQDLTISGYTEGADFELEESYNDILISNTYYELIDDCNVTTSWTVVADAASITNNSTYYQRYDKSLNLIKTSTASKYFGYEKNLSSSIDMTNKQGFVNYRINNTTIQNKITKITFYYGTNSTNNFQFEYTASDMDVGGTIGNLPRVKLDYKSSTVNGNPDISAIDYIKIYIEMDNSSDTIASGDLLMDFWFASTSEDYNGDVIKWLTFSTSDTVLSATYKPLSYEIESTATTIGADGNIAIGEVNYKESVLSSIDSIYNFMVGEDGSDKEEDFDYRERIKSAADIRGSATVPAIEAAVKELSSVKDCVVIDTPEEAISGELHTYNSSTEKFHLNYEQALDDSGLTITGYVKDTDFQLNTATNDVEFGIGGTDPTNLDVLTVGYTVARLGKIDILVTGETGALTVGQLEDVDEIAQEEVSAGISYTVDDPTYTSTNLEITINVDSNYNETDVKTAAEELCVGIFNTLNIGESLLISNIISTVVFMPGIINVTTVLIDAATSDKTADEDEILSQGTITINVA